MASDDKFLELERTYLDSQRDPDVYAKYLDYLRRVNAEPRVCRCGTRVGRRAERPEGPQPGDPPLDVEHCPHDPLRHVDITLTMPQAELVDHAFDLVPQFLAEMDDEDVEPTDIIFLPLPQWIQQSPRYVIRIFEEVTDFELFDYLLDRIRSSDSLFPIHASSMAGLEKKFKNAFRKLGWQEDD
jgi:hypothetical protein